MADETARLITKRRMSLAPGKPFTETLACGLCEYPVSMDYRFCPGCGVKLEYVQPLEVRD